MFDICKRDASWFIAAQNGDIESIKKKMAKNLKTKDFRSTKQSEDIYKGFTALDYACYFGKLDIVKLLLEHELGVYTTQECAIRADGFSKEARYRLPVNSTCLAIALLAGQDSVIKYITSYLEDNPDKQDLVVGHLDKDGNTTYQIACMCDTKQSHAYLKNSMYIDAELFLVSDGDATAIMNGAYFGRPETCRILSDLAEDEKYQKDLYKMALTRDTYDCNCMDVAVQEVDYKKFSTTEEDKKECYNILRELCMKAYKYAEEDDDLADTLQAFKGDDKDFDDVFDESKYEQGAGNGRKETEEVEEVEENNEENNEEAGEEEENNEDEE